MKVEFPRFTRCCCCLPLRRGVIAFGYINLMFALSMILIFSVLVHEAVSTTGILYHGVVSSFLIPEIGLFLYSLEVVFNAILLYGAHANKPVFLRVFFYYGVSTIVACFLIEVLEILTTPINWIWYFTDIEAMSLFFAGICLHIYLLGLTWSLLQKMNSKALNHYENPLHEIVVDEAKTDNESISNDISN